MPYSFYTPYCAFLMLLIKILPIVLCLYSMSFLFFGGTTFTVHAQSDLQTIKYRDLVIDLGNGIKTNAQFTYPAVGGNGKYPGVLLKTDSGEEEMNSTGGFILIDKKTEEKISPPTPFFQIAQYL